LGKKSGHNEGKAAQKKGAPQCDSDSINKYSPSDEESLPVKEIYEVPANSPANP